MMTSAPVLRWPILMVLMLLSVHLFSQTETNFGILPRINLSYDLNSKSRLVFGTESRLRTSEEEVNYILTDINALISRRIGLQSKLNGGYLIRLRDGRTFHRFLQQLSIVRKWNASRFSHRIATDQTFTSQDDPVFRLRYRFVWESPLAGEKINWKEFYLKAGGEVLGIFQQQSSEVEFRLVPAIGFEVNGKNKLELGLDYRVGDFVDSEERKKDLWATFSWYFTI